MKSTIERKPDLGTFYDAIEQLSASIRPSCSYLARDWENADEWRRDAREMIHELLGFKVKNVPLNSSVDSREIHDGLVTEEISYALPYGPRTKGFFLYPEKHEKKLPAFLALHDHGGFFYFGKEKIVESKIQSKALSDFKSGHYSGRSWANELAKHGFAVLSVDVSLWGSRKISLDSVNPELTKFFENLKPDSEEFIQRFNEYWDSIEAQITISTLLHSGACWPGIQLFEDQRSLDYLLTRPEIDPERIGCGGLSMGGQRTIFLAGLDPRIKFAVCVGFMSTVHEMLRNHIRGNGVGFYVPRLAQLMDLPDVISLHAPHPLMVLYNNEDGLFSIEGQQEADRKLALIYSKMGFKGNYVGRFYGGRHKFDSEMQEDAFAWLEKQVGASSQHAAL
jgi:dienelactone hydrolase